MIEKFEAVLEAVEICLKISSIKNDIVEIRNTDKPTCGHCRWWMKSSKCPAESNSNGHPKGPNMNSPSCKDFLLEEWVKSLKIERIEKVKEKIQTMKKEEQRALMCWALKHPFCYTWPGQDRKCICLEHSFQLSGIADAMGMYLQLIPLTIEETKTEHCSQKIKEEV